MKAYVMDHVAGIEELGDSEVNVARSRSPCTIATLELVAVVEDEVISTIRAVVVHPVRAALPVLVSEDVITKRGCVVDDSVSGIAFVGLPRVIRSRYRMPTKRRCNLVIGRDLQ